MDHALVRIGLYLFDIAGDQVAAFLDRAGRHDLAQPVELGRDAAAEIPDRRQVDPLVQP